MARTPQFVKKLTTCLPKDLKAAGIDAKVDSEPVAGTKLHRFIVVAKGFGNLGHTERQDLVWRIAARYLTPQEQLLISMILTLTPSEAGEIEGRRSAS